MEENRERKGRMKKKIYREDGGKKGRESGGKREIKGGYIALFPPEREGKNIDGGKNV